MSLLASPLLPIAIAVGVFVIMQHAAEQSLGGVAAPVGANARGGAATADNTLASRARERLEGVGLLFASVEVWVLFLVLRFNFL